MTVGSFARRCGAILVVGMLSLGAGPLRAASITVDFLAENIQPGNSATTDATFALLGLARGESVTGRFTFDPTFPDDREQFAGFFDRGRSFAASFSVTIGSTTYEAPFASAVSIETVSNPFGVAADVFAIAGGQIFDSVPGVRFSTASITTSEPDLDRFNGLFRDFSIIDAMSVKSFEISFFESQTNFVEFRSDQVTFSAVTAVPAPLPAVLLLTGLGGLAMMRRRARRAAA